MCCNIYVTGETLLGMEKDTDTELVKWLCASKGLPKVHWTRTTVGVPNDLGGSVTAGIRAKPISLDIMKHFKMNFQILIQENIFHSYLATFWKYSSCKTR
jgi:signal transduction protein with GAF and PtsI domain